MDKKLDNTQVVLEALAIDDENAVLRERAEKAEARVRELEADCSRLEQERDSHQRLCISEMLRVNKAEALATELRAKLLRRDSGKRDPMDDLGRTLREGV